MSGNTILKDGRSINENYGTDLDKLEEQDRVGVVRTSNGDLVFYVNGVIIFQFQDKYWFCAYDD